MQRWVQLPARVTCTTSPGKPPPSRHERPAEGMRSSRRPRLQGHAQSHHHEPIGPMTWAATDGNGLVQEPRCRAFEDVCAGVSWWRVPEQKKESCECMAWNILGDQIGARIPFATLLKSLGCKCGCKPRYAFDGLLKIFSWPTKRLTLGMMSAKRHDG